MTETEPARQALFAQVRSEVIDARRASYEQFDKSMLTLASAGLILSLTLSGGVADLTRTACVWSLVASWWLFLLTIVLMVTSFLTSIWGLNACLRTAEDYYLRSEAIVLYQANPMVRLTQALSISATLTFAAALSCSVLFVTANLPL